MAVLGLTQAGAPVINVDVKDREVISGERHFRVTVEAKSPVSQVEFYVGSDLRDSDTSTPYEFKLDTLAEEEGDLKVTFAAYTTDGKSSKKVLTLKVDNGVSKGADFHVKAAADFLRDSKWDEAITAGRIALKAQKGYNPARLVLARAYMGKSVLDRAQKFAEDVVADDPKNLQALELLSVINLQRAFATINRGGKLEDTQKLFAEALKSAVESRRKSIDSQVDGFGQITDENRLQYVDLAMKAGRFSLVPQTLSSVFASDISNAAIGNRLAYAQVKLGRFAEARATLKDLDKKSAMDGYSYALLATIETDAGNREASDAAMKEAVLSDSENLGVRTAQAYIALKNSNNQVLSRLASDLARDQGQRTEVNYFLSALTNRLQDYERSRKYFELSVLSDPCNSDMYVERGNESINIALNGGLQKKDADVQLENARILFQTALEAQPSSYQALTGLSIVNLLMGKGQDAVKFGEAAVKSNENYAGAYYALSAAYASVRAVGESQKANLKAGSLDKVNLEGREVPDGKAAFRYFSNGGRTLVMSTPK
ncbi:MAG: hypothetical protein BGO01_09565 [Armatimonadetes bacterium 55-13]|nr:MAG: hypothetical protein BGO01_09565 [Armatimonadetes bacterium 55-13]